MSTICFDVDGTLIYEIGENEDTPRLEVINMVNFFKEHTDFNVYVWSQGGVEYAEEWVKKLHLDVKVIEKGSVYPDISIDNEVGNLGRVNIRV
jgi:hypothetical protein